ncbi:MAG: asparagine synthase (glutamine-hydrolyzing), partial [Deltaproteobacteria bacterium]|nr:asparagine synthase (glutamine-hydrolyzing) [Deltaproteobacteria bacterium]
MCGLTGEVRFDRAPDAQAVRRASDAIAHRGPDAEGFFTEGPAAFGHRRLSILDIAGGVQPMIENGVVLIFNGQIYRHEALREELRQKGHTFRTRSDTEVVLRAFLEWGEDFASHLDGMFALALWEPWRERLVLARDRVGKKPLYYALFNHGASAGADPVDDGATRAASQVVFASELKALFARGDVPKDLDETAFVQYLAAESVPGSRSILRGVHKLPAAHVAVFDRTGFRVRRYWELPAPSAEARAHSSHAHDSHLPSGELYEAGQKLLSLLDGAVARRLVADVPVGVFLSGGIDSSTLSALAARHKSPLDTFSIGFQEASFDETPYALTVAKHIGSRHQVETLSGQDCVDLLPAAVDSLCEPLADASFLPTLLLSRFTRKHVTVALAGDGGDELFAGYDPFL